MRTLTHPSLEPPAPLLQARVPILKKMLRILSKPARDVMDGRRKPDDEKSLYKIYHNNGVR